jgi:8-oxo-dGTP pyrophosphatase MutT (NUDIX family)
MGVDENTSKAIGATVLLRDGTILMQLRDDGRGTSIPYPNMRNFPGGAAEPDEEPLDAAIREMAEEFETSASWLASGATYYESQTDSAG